MGWTGPGFGRRLARAARSVLRLREAPQLGGAADAAPSGRHAGGAAGGCHRLTGGRRVAGVGCGRPCVSPWEMF